METSSKSSFIIGTGLVVLIVIAVAVGLHQKTSAPANIPVTTNTDTPLSEPAATTPGTASTQSKKIMNIATLQTNMGDITVQLNPENAPNTVANFEKLANQGFYTDIRFHRVIKGFMIQAGDPLSKDPTKKSAWGTGGPGYTFADELTGKETYPQGTVAMANAGPNTNGSQFFIVTASPAAPLPPSYTVFGHVTKGMDVALKIENVKTETNDRPVSDVIIQKVIIE